VRPNVYPLFYPNLMIISNATHAATSSVNSTYAAASSCNFFEAKLIRFVRYLGKFEQIWVKFGQIWLDLGNIKILHPPKNSISYGYAEVSFISRQYSETTGMNLNIENNMLRLLYWTISVRPVLWFIDFPFPSICSICRCRSKAIMTYQGHS